MVDTVTQILNFWFDDPDRPNTEYGQERRIWFRKNPEFDQTIRDTFLPVYEEARQGQRDEWQQTPHGTLALTILLDQFPRNMFRGSARSFEADKQAIAVAQTGIKRGDDRALLPIQRMFLYLPLEHSENLDHQNQSVALFEQLVMIEPALRSPLEYAYRHRDVIAQFGRFPHRNDVLGRTSTPAELAFLQQPGSRFG